MEVPLIPTLPTVPNLGSPVSGAFSPSSIAGLQAWYKDTGIVESGGDITSWQDSSGNGNHLTPPLTPPQFGLEILSGINAVFFDTPDGAAGTPLTKGSALLAGTAATLFFVGNKSGTWPEAGFYTGFTHAHHHPFSDISVYDGGFATVRKNCGAQIVPILDNWRIFSIRSQDGQYGIEIDGASQFSTGTNTFSLGTDFVLGAGTWAAGATANALQGYIIEVIVYNALLSAGQRAQVVGYLQDRFNI